MKTSKENSDRHCFLQGDIKVVNTTTKLTSVIFLNDDFESGGLTDLTRKYN